MGKSVKQIRELYTQVYKCAFCGRFFRSGRAYPDMCLECSIKALKNRD